jgi:TrmH family RNA methyltransferase
MITSDANPQIKELVKLQKNARYRKKQGLFVVEGIKLTNEAASHGKLCKVYIRNNLYEEQWAGKTEKEIATYFSHGENHVAVELVDDHVFDTMADTVTPQGILGVARIPEYSLKQILSHESRLYLLLDNLRDPGNLGTIIRTAEGVGVSGVILSKESVDLFNPKVVRSTMGSIFRVPFLYVDNLPQTIETLKSSGTSVYGTFMEGSEIYYEKDFKKPSAIVIGNEANGISPSVKETLSGHIRIPMEGKLESLNAAVSAAVVLYEAARQRKNITRN